jgi:hypothetical protein
VAENARDNPTFGPRLPREGGPEHSPPRDKMLIPFGLPFAREFSKDFARAQGRFCAE